VEGAVGYDDMLILVDYNLTGCSVSRDFIDGWLSLELAVAAVPLLNLGRTAMLSGAYGKAGYYFDRC
jgi:hypothetical protein